MLMKSMFVLPYELKRTSALNGYPSNYYAKMHRIQQDA